MIDYIALPELSIEFKHALFSYQYKIMIIINIRWNDMLINFPPMLLNISWFSPSFWN